MIPQPRDLKAEMAVIGSMLIEPEAIRRARQIIEDPRHFYEDRNAVIFQAACKMQEAGTAVDLITLSDELRRQGQLEAVGGQAYLAECMDVTPTAAHVEYHAKIINRYAYEREIFRTIARIQEAPDAAKLAPLEDLFRKRDAVDSPAAFTYKESLFGILDELASPAKTGKLYPFGIPALDDICDGSKPGEVNVFGAMTNAGKSLLLLNLMDRAASAGNRCLFVGSEMTARETWERHLSITSGVEAWKVRRREWSKPDFDAALEAIAAKHSKMPVEILDLPEPSLRDIESAAIRSKAELIFVDYLQRLNLPEAKDYRLRVVEAMRGIKSMARRLNAVINVASQLNRRAYDGKPEAGQADAGKEKPPTLADLSESSAIEKEADKVFVFWQPRRLQPPPNPNAWNTQSVIEVFKLKDRSGSKGISAQLNLDGATLKITGKTL